MDRQKGSGFNNTIRQILQRLDNIEKRLERIESKLPKEEFLIDESWTGTEIKCKK